MNKTFLTQQVLWLLTALLIAVSLTVPVKAVVLNENVQISSDPETLDSYKTILSSEDGSPVSTRNAGEIWADKSAFANSDHVEDFKVDVDGKSYTTQDPIIEVFSALGKKHQVTGYSDPPVDLSIILDVSKSMGMPDGPSGAKRIEVAVKSVNEMIDYVMGLSPKNRVAVSLFGLGSAEILPLSHYEPGGEYIKLSLDTKLSNEQIIEAEGCSFSLSTECTGENKTFTNDERDESGATILGDSTNLEAGLEAGLGALRRGKEYPDNQPQAVLITDGECNSMDTLSWEMSQSNMDQMLDPGRLDDALTENLILKTLLTGAYQKALVEESYGEDLRFEAMAINIKPDPTDKQHWAIKQATLNTRAAFNAESENSIVAGTYKKYRDWYEKDTPVQVEYDNKPLFELSAFSAAKVEGNITKEQIDGNISFIDNLYDITATQISDVFSALKKDLGTQSYSLTDQSARDENGNIACITYEDPIGEYMRLGEVKALSLYGQVYPVKEVSGENSRVFRAQANNPDETPVDTIKIECLTDEAGDETLRVIIPETLLPVIKSDVVVKFEGSEQKVESYECTAGDVYSKPLRLIYTIRPAEEILDGDQLKTDNVNSDYRQRNSEGDELDFYANCFGGDDGRAQLSFIPSKENPYYYNQEAQTVYTDKNMAPKNVLDSPEKLQDENSYYYYSDYYKPDGSDGATLEREVVSRKGSELKDKLALEGTTAVTKAGTELLGDKTRYDISKKDNKTSTAKTSYTQTRGQDVYILLLGNNAKMAAVSEKNPTLKIEKSHTVGKMEPTKETLTIAATDIITYFLTISNIGNGDSGYFIVKDELPEGLVLQADSISDKGYIVGDTLYWEIDSLKANSSITVSFAAKVSQTTNKKVFENVAFVTDETEDYILPSNTVVEKLLDCDYEIVKKQALNDGTPTTEHLNAAAGDLVTYTITVTNTGKIPIENLNVVDTIPEGLILHEDSFSKDAILSGRTVTWVIKILSVGESEDLSFKVTVPKNEGFWRNVAHAKSGPLDIPSNEVTISCGEPALSLVKTQSLNGAAETKDTVIANDGDVVTYYFRLRNIGSGDAHEVVVTDPVPEGLDVIEETISHSGTHERNNIIWKFDHLEPEEEKTLSFSAKLLNNDQINHYSNTARLEHREGDEPLLSNTVEIDQPGQGEVLIHKSQSTGTLSPTDQDLSVEPGDIVTYYILVTNTGNRDVERYQVSDNVEAELAILTSSLDAEASVTGNTIVWSLTNLKAQTSRVLSFQVQIPTASSKTQWKNCASLILPEATIASNTVRVSEEPVVAAAEDPTISYITRSTNTSNVASPETTTPGSIPKTGIRSGLLFWIVLCCVSLVVLLTAHVFTILKNSKNQIKKK